MFALLLALPVLAAEFPAAPALDVTVVQGDAVDLNGGNLVLVEEWATWCGPCHQVAPMLSLLDQADDLDVIGISSESAVVVKRHLAKHPDRMTYTVAVDKAKATLRPLNQLSRAQGIPYSYLVQHGEVLWHGHPGSVPMVLDAVRNGRWTPDAPERAQRTRYLVTEYFQVVGSDPSKAAELGGEAVSIGDVAPDQLNRLAWDILTSIPEDQRDCTLAVKAAEAAVNATGERDWAILDTYALALWLDGQPEEARAKQSLAVERCRADAGDCGELETRLRDFGGA